MDGHAPDDPSASATATPAPLRCVELFAGCGGLALGVAHAGFEHALVVERDAQAHATLESNKKKGIKYVATWPLRRGDVQEVNYAELVGTIDLVAGGPPCQPFSIGGKHEGPADERNMWPEAIRAVRELRPKAFLFENVAGLLRPSFEPYLNFLRIQLAWPECMPRPKETWEDHLKRLIQRETEERGPSYRVRVIPINAADYGAPQKRHRAIVVGIASDVAETLDAPPPTHSREALIWSKWETGEYWERHEIPTSERPAITPAEARILAQMKGKERPSSLPWTTVRDALRGLPEPVPEGANVLNHVLHPGARVYPRHTGSSWDEPAKALKAGDHGVPGGENILAPGDGTVRYFTLREMARLQGFPDDFAFGEGWKGPIKQLGNAVPVHVGETFGASLFSLISKARVVNAAREEKMARLSSFHRRFHALFPRAEQRVRSLKFLACLTDGVPWTDVRQLSRQMGEKTPNGTFRLLHGSKWSANAARDRLVRYCQAQFGEPDAVLAIDEIDFIRVGRAFVGAAPQHARSTGSVDNCQIGLFAGYLSSRGTVLLDRRLFLPREWCRDPERRERAEVPAGVDFVKKATIAVRMWRYLHRLGFPMAWITVTNLDGEDRLLRSVLHRDGARYVVAANPNRSVRQVGGGGRARAASVIFDVGASWSASAWETFAGNGEPALTTEFEWARERVIESFKSGAAAKGWLFARREVNDRKKIAWFMSNAGLDVSLKQLAEVASAQERLRGLLDEARGRVGLDRYEVYSWPGWNRFMTLCMMAMAWMEESRREPPPPALEAPLPEVMPIVTDLREENASDTPSGEWSLDDTQAVATPVLALG